MNPQIFETAEKLVDLLKQNNLKIATAESCTGGMVSSFITSVSGVSDVFEMGMVSILSAKFGTLLRKVILHITRWYITPSSAIT